MMAGPDKGDGSFASSRQLAERRGVAERVTFPGAAPKNSLRDLFESGDVFLNTARVDNTPVSVLEAMAAGLCIVSTQAGGLRYLLHHERDALLTDSNQPHAMAAAVRRLLLQPGLAEQLSRTARRNVEPYDWAEILPLWERLFFDAASYREARCLARIERRMA
jgi:glycosyltransferase involved in cell wall biosynthesis